MDLSFVEVMLTPWAFALLGLCIGSFLNVVIHRLPQMLDRGWKAECAETAVVLRVLRAPQTLNTRAKAHTAVSTYTATQVGVMRWS